MENRMRYAAAACGMIAMLVTTSALAHGITQGELEVIHPWVTPTDAHLTHAHPTIANNGETPIVLTGREADVADTAAFLIGDWQVSEIVLPGGEILAPDEFRVVLNGVENPLKEGDHFEATLKVKGADDLSFHMVVGENTEMPDMDMNMDDMPAKM